MVKINLFYFILIYLNFSLSFCEFKFAILNESNVEFYWKKFKENYRKNYRSRSSNSFRKKVFTANLANILTHNHKADLGLKSFKLGINQFSDMTSDEFLLTQTALKLGPFVPKFIYESSPYRRIRYSLDWRERRILPPVRDQGECGACWAFTVINVIQSQLALRGKYYNLSAQNLIDCTKGNHGCNGGFLTPAYQYIIANKGLASEKAYPYVGHTRKCKDRNKRLYAPLRAFVDIEAFDEKALAQALNEIGPIAVAIDASSLFFRFYKSGVYDDFFCSQTNSNHALVLVGYNNDHWILQNSWGKEWGENGYVRMKRHKNLCGLATFASFPVLA